MESVPQIRTTEQLREFMQQVGGKPVTDANLIRFKCYYDARLLVDSATTNDIATILQEGVKPAEIGDVQDWINTFFEDVDEEDIAQQNVYIVNAVLHFYGKPELDLNEDC